MSHHLSSVLICSHLLRSLSSLLFYTVFFSSRLSSPLLSSLVYLSLLYSFLHFPVFARAIPPSLPSSISRPPFDMPYFLSHPILLLYPILYCPTSSVLILPYPTLPYPTLPYPTLPYPTLPYTTLPYPTKP